MSAPLKLGIAGLGTVGSCVARLIEHERDALAARCGRGIEVVVEADDRLPLIQGSQGDLEQLLLNLLTNSRDAMPKGGCLTFETMNFEATRKMRGSTFSSWDWVGLFVTDTGHGMSSSVLESADSAPVAREVSFARLAVSVCSADLARAVSPSMLCASSVSC